MSQIHSTQTSSKGQTATSVSPLDTQATAQNDISWDIRTLSNCSTAIWF